MIDYNDPNLNIMLCTPGRTGSTLIKYVFGNICQITPTIRRHVENIEPMQPKQLLHSHYVNDVYLGNDHTVYIISTRNILDICYSKLIGNRTKQYVFYPNDPLQIKPFNLTKQEFWFTYTGVNRYYKEVKQILKYNYITIDYDEFKDDITKIFEKFNLPKIYLENYKFKNWLPVKTPGSYKEWIINFEDIDSWAKSLPSGI